MPLGITTEFHHHILPSILLDFFSYQCNEAISHDSIAVIFTTIMGVRQFNQGKTTVILLLVDYLLILLTMLLWLIQTDRDRGFTMRLCLPHKPREFEIVSGPFVTPHTPFLLYGRFYKSCWHCKAFPCSIYTPRLYSHEQTITMNSEVRRVRMQIQNAIGHFQSCKTSSAEGK